MKTDRTAPRLLPLALALCLLAPALAAKGIKRGDAQKAIAAVPPFTLNKGNVVVKEINSTETSATVRAGMRVAFRFERDERGAWRVAQVRTGDRQWEEVELLARAAGADRLAPARAALEDFAAELDALRLAAAKLKAEEKKREERQKTRPGESAGPARNAGVDSAGESDKSSGEFEKRAGKSKEKTPEPPEEEFVRGALSVKKPAEALSAMGSSALVEIEIDSTFELVRERGKWRVASARVGAENVREFDALLRALDAAKAERARGDLAALAAALEAYRRERGFYVVADTGVALVDQLNPRYTPLFIRFDPWHRPYEYEGAPGGFTLRSLGPDGKPGTADDVTRRNGER